jgi:hypothetical protein
VALESNLLEKCRPDGADLRIVAGDGSFVPYALEDGKSRERSAPTPVRVFKVTRTPGKWTDVWIDKTTKFLSSGLLVQTSSKDFVRKVEIRGSDNGRDAYIIKMDGLLFDVSRPFPVTSLDLTHPLNNFQYIHLRIMDGEMPALKIDGALCHPPAPDPVLSTPLDLRILENHPEPGTGSTIVVGDLGDRRFPLTRLTLVSPEKEFIREVTVYAGNSSSPETWKRVCGSTIFRLRKEDATKEKLEISMPGELSRYVKLVVSGDKTPITLTTIEATGTMRVAMFEFRRGSDYRVLYANSRAAAPNPAEAPKLDVHRLLAAAPVIQTGEERKNVVTRRPPLINPPEKSNAAIWGKLVGLSILLMGLLLLFSLVLKAVASKRERNSRIHRSRIRY